MDRGREMPLELLPARSQYLYATAGNAPAVCSFFFHPCLFLGLLVISHASSGQVWVVFWWFGGMCLSGWVVCVLDTITQLCLRLPQRGALHLLIVGAHQTRRCAPVFGWGFWFSRTPAQCRLRSECGPNLWVSAEAPAWPGPLIPQPVSNLPEHWEPSRATESHVTRSS